MATLLIIFRIFTATNVRYNVLTDSFPYGEKIDFHLLREFLIVTSSMTSHSFSLEVKHQSKKKLETKKITFKTKKSSFLHTFEFRLQIIFFFGEVEMKLFHFFPQNQKNYHIHILFFKLLSVTGSDSFLFFCGP